MTWKRIYFKNLLAFLFSIFIVATSQIILGYDFPQHQYIAKEALDLYRLFRHTTHPTETMAPTVGLSTDKSTYTEGEPIQTYLTLKNHGPDKLVDAYISLTSPDAQNYYLIFVPLSASFGWQRSDKPLPIAASVLIQSGLVLENYKWFEINLSEIISNPPQGTYLLKAWLTEPGTSTIIGEVAKASFTFQLIESPTEKSYFGLSVGNWWNYEVSGTVGNYNARVEVTGIDDITYPGKTVWIIDTFESGKGHSLREWVEETGTEIKGLKVEDFKEGTTFHFDSPLLSLKNPLVIGDSWDTTSPLTAELSGLGTFRGNWKQSTTVLSQESVSTLAGTFNAYKVYMSLSITINIYGSPLTMWGDSTLWFVPYLGEIKEIVELNGVYLGQMKKEALTVVLSDYKKP